MIYSYFFTSHTLFTALMKKEKEKDNSLKEHKNPINPSNSIEKRKRKKTMVYHNSNLI